MAAESRFRIEEDDADFIVRFSKADVDRERISRFLDLLEFEEIRSRSELTEEQAAELATDVNRAVWQANAFRAEVQ